MTKPNVHKPGEDDTTELSIPIITVPNQLIIEEPPIDDEDTAQSLPINVIPIEPISEKSSIDDADTISKLSKKRGKSKRHVQRTNK